MYNKKAIWSFILSLIQFICFIAFMLLFFPVFFFHIFPRVGVGIVAFLVLMIISFILSVFFAIFSFRDFNNSPDLAGKWMSVTAVILDLLSLLILGYFGLRNILG